MICYNCDRSLTAVPFTNSPLYGFLCVIPERRESQKSKHLFLNSGNEKPTGNELLHNKLPSSLQLATCALFFFLRLFVCMSVCLSVFHLSVNCRLSNTRPAMVDVSNMPLFIFHCSTLLLFIVFVVNKISDLVSFKTVFLLGSDVCAETEIFSTPVRRCSASEDHLFSALQMHSSSSYYYYYYFDPR